MAARLDINLGKNTRGKIATGRRDATLGKYVTLHLYDPFNLSSLFPSFPLPVGCIPLHLHLHTIVPYRALFLLQSYVLSKLPGPPSFTATFLRTVELQRTTSLPFMRFFYAPFFHLPFWLNYRSKSRTRKVNFLC